eukprot:557104-Rhodomonas_salina.1
MDQVQRQEQAGKRSSHNAAILFHVEPDYLPIGAPQQQMQQIPCSCTDAVLAMRRSQLDDIHCGSEGELHRAQHDPAILGLVELTIESDEHDIGRRWHPSQLGDQGIEVSVAADHHGPLPWRQSEDFLPPRLYVRHRGGPGYRRKPSVPGRVCSRGGGAQPNMRLLAQALWHGGHLVTPAVIQCHVHVRNLCRSTAHPGTERAAKAGALWQSQLRRASTRGPCASGAVQ